MRVRESEREGGRQEGTETEGGSQKPRWKLIYSPAPGTVVCPIHIRVWGSQSLAKLTPTCRSDTEPLMLSAKGELAEPEFGEGLTPASL